jgi:hypothetical protein
MGANGRLLPSHLAPFVRYGYLFGEFHTTPTFDAVTRYLQHDRDLTILNVIWTPGMAAYRTTTECGR